MIPNELIVRLKPGAKIDDLARALGAKVIGRIDSLNAYRLQFQDQIAADTAREQLAANADVASVDSNYSIDRPAAPVGHNPRTCRRHRSCSSSRRPATAGSSWASLIPPSSRWAMASTVPAQSHLRRGGRATRPDNPSHGTSMAETILRSIAAMTKGSSSVQILPVDVYGPNSSTSTFDVANGIAQAVNNGATMINLSLGSDGDSSFLHGVIQDASSKNILFIGAAGNQPVTTPFYPAAYPEVNAVTAIDQGQIAITPIAAASFPLARRAPASSITTTSPITWRARPRPLRSPAASPPATWTPPTTESARCRRISAASSV